MATKIFLDTNVVIDFFDPLRAEHLNAVKLFAAAENGEAAGFVSESVLNTLVYILRKQFSPKELREILGAILSFIDLLLCTSGIYRHSLNLAARDIEDAVLYQLAIENGLDYFITEDKKDFKKFSLVSLPVISAKEFLSVSK